MRMPSRYVTRSLGHATERVPGLRRIPIVKLVAAAELALIAHDHLIRLSPRERRRLIELVRIGHGRRSRLTDDEREELEDLIFKLQTRSFFGDAVDRMSPVPLPRRILYGPKSKRR